jgi:hypothetical protein
MYYGIFEQIFFYEAEGFSSSSPGADRPVSGTDRVPPSFYHSSF